MKSRKTMRGRRSVHPENAGPTGLETTDHDMFCGPERADHKTIQVCRQVEEAISWGLASSANPVLRDLHVLGVEPVRGVALLRVLVATEEPDTDHVEITEALERARGYLRGEVARAINRKRVPSLDVVLVPPGRGGAGEWCEPGCEEEDREHQRGEGSDE